MNDSAALSGISLPGDAESRIKLSDGVSMAANPFGTSLEIPLEWIAARCIHYDDFNVGPAGCQLRKYGIEIDTISLYVRFFPDFCVHRHNVVLSVVLQTYPAEIK